jgi:hypothetical protein
MGHCHEKSLALECGSKLPHFFYFGKRRMFSRFLTRLAALAGICGPILFGLTLAMLTLAKWDFLRSLGWDPITAPTFDWPSGLALGAYGWVTTSVFIVTGILIIFFAFGLFPTLPASSVSRAALTLLVLSGLAVAGLAFTTDPTIRSTPATWHGRLHDASFVLLGLTLLPSMLLLGTTFRHDPRWKSLSLYTFFTLALVFPSFWLKGIAFYIFLLAILVWMEIVAFRLAKLAYK